MSPRICFSRSGADRPVEGRAGEQRTLVRHAGGQPAPGSPDFRVHSRLRGQVSLHSDFSGGNRARRTAGPDPASYFEQDAAGGDAERHAGRPAKPRSFLFVWMMQVKRRWPHSSVSSPLSVVSDHGFCPPGSLSAGASAGVLVQPPWADGETCPGVCHDRVDEQAAPLLWTVRGESQVRWLDYFLFFFGLNL